MNPPNSRGNGWSDALLTRSPSSRCPRSCQDLAPRRGALRCQQLPAPTRVRTARCVELRDPQLVSGLARARTRKHTYSRAVRKRRLVTLSFTRVEMIQGQLKTWSLQTRASLEPAEGAGDVDGRRRLVGAWGPSQDGGGECRRPSAARRPWNRPGSPWAPGPPPLPLPQAHFLSTYLSRICRRVSSSLSTGVTCGGGGAGARGRGSVVEGSRSPVAWGSTKRACGEDAAGRLGRVA
jgi:hypothetical protein